MVKLSDIFLITIGARTIFFITVHVFHAFNLSYDVFKDESFFTLCQLKIRYVILITVAGSILLFFSMAAIYKITSTIEIASVKNDLKTCTSLKAQFTFGDPKTYKIISGDITIEDSNVLGRFAALMANVKYERWTGGGYLATVDKMDIILYKNDAQIRHFRILLDDFLETNDTLGANTYRCSDSSLAEKIREILSSVGNRHLAQIMTIEKLRREH